MIKKILKTTAISTLLSVLLLPVSFAAPVTAERIIHANDEPQNWLSHGRGYQEQRFSPLKKINDTNVKQLGLAWYFDTNSNRGLEATPLIIDGVMYATGVWSVVYALDAKTGKKLWEYDPEVPKAWGKFACCDAVNRGVAAWGNSIYVGTLDGRLVAINRLTGEKQWETLTIDKKHPYTITGAPRVVKGQVIIGNGGAEYGVRGYVSAYDASTGKMSWRFYVVPGNPANGFETPEMEMAAKTWTGQWWEHGGGGTVWDSMAYDPELDLLYIGTGNGSPWNRKIRSPGGGDNLFLSSVVALKPDTGEYVWHYQETPSDNWDYTSTQHMILADIKWKGEPKKVIFHAPKNGFFFVIDRVTGELLSAEPYADINWATHYDMTTGRPVETPEASYQGSDSMFIQKPSSMGAHNWQPMSYSPKTGLVYIPKIFSGINYKELDEPYQSQHGHFNLGVYLAERGIGDAQLQQILTEKFTSGSLLAWDPIKQKPAWENLLPLAWNGGVLSTAGNLVIHGTGDRYLRIYRADTGALLWQFPTQTGVIASPVTYEIDGEQYISVMAGWGGAFGLGGGVVVPPGPKRSRLLTFKLGGTDTLPPVPEQAAFPEPPPKMDVSKDALIKGETLYIQYCSACHGNGAVSNKAIPDLRRMEQSKHDAFDLIVLKGAFRNLGMVGFDDVLTEEDARHIHAWLIEKAHEDKRLREQPQWLTDVKDFFYRILAWFIGLLT